MTPPVVTRRGGAPDGPSSADPLSAGMTADDHDGGPAGDHESTTESEIESGRAPWTVRAIESYQRAFEGRPSPCRFTPSCSVYAHEAFTRYGTFRGGWLTLRRLLRCRPFGPSGWDPVPEPPILDPEPVDGERP